MTTHYNWPHRQAGVTLVELMVALVLGLLMTAAVIQTYLATKQTYSVTNGINRIQENARFGHYFITKDLREAGSRGCINGIRNMLSVDPPNDYLPFKSPVSGWEFANTSVGDTVTIPDTPTTPNNGWSGDGAFPNFLQGDVVAGSDVISFISFEPTDVTLVDGQSATSFELLTTGAHDLVDNSILLIGSCNQADLFLHDSEGASSSISVSDRGASPGNDPAADSAPKIWSNNYGTDTQVYELVTTYYFLQPGRSGPSLFRLRAKSFPVDESAKEELVEGVESMQIYYGIDTTDDENPNRYVSADAVASSDWENVVSLRIGLLFRSAQNAADEDQTGSYTLLDTITIDHASDDNLLRYAVNSTVKLRNRGLPARLGDDLVCNGFQECN